MRRRCETPEQDSLLADVGEGASLEAGDQAVLQAALRQSPQATALRRCIPHPLQTCVTEPGGRSPAAHILQKLAMSQVLIRCQENNFPGHGFNKTRLPNDWFSPN